MKMKTIWFIVILVVFITMIINVTSNNEKAEFIPLELNIGDEFTGLEFKNAMYVINYLINDVTGDNEKDMIILVGEKETIDSTYSKNVDLVVYDTVSKTFFNAGLKKFQGDMPKIILSDLTGDGINEIIITLENNTKEKDVRIISNNNGTLKEILGVKENKGINFYGEMIDGIKAHVRCNKLNKELYIDLTDKKSELITNKKIDESGKIISENKKVSTSGFKTIELVEINGQKGIQTTQIITAFDNTEIVDEITAIWKYEEGKWQIKEVRGIKVGNLI